MNPKTVKRPLRPWDALFCWRLANDPTVLKSTVSGSPPTWHGHLRWMAKWMFGRNRRAWVVSVQEGKRRSAAALVRVEKIGRSAEISIEVMPDFRKRGVARSAIQFVSAWSRYAGWGTPTAYIREHNIASRRAFAAVGFRAVVEMDGWVAMVLRW